MQVFDFEHLSAASAAALARTYADAGVAIMTDSVFAADGGVAPLAGLLAALPSHLPPQRAALLVDDCHGVCVLGPGGRGSVAAAGLSDPRIVLTTTLAKGLGCYGGAVLGTTDFVTAVREHAWVYRGSTPVPPSIACAAREALACLRDEPQIIDRLRANMRQLRAAFQRLGLRVPDEGIPIFTFALDSPQRQRDVHERLLARGVLAPLIQYPGGPAETYFRVVVNAAHTPEHIATLISELHAALEATAPSYAGPRMTSVA
jgi:8-amino-7-oxononanoate synthase